MNVNCPNCGVALVLTNPKDLSGKRCPSCGSSLVRRIEGELPENRAEPRCCYCWSPINPFDGEICSYCGYPHMYTSEPKKCTSVSSDEASPCIPNALYGAQVAKQSSTGRLSFLLGFLCLIVPFLGIIVWSDRKSRNPRAALAALLLSIYPSLVMVMGIVIAASSSRVTGSASTGNTASGSSAASDVQISETQVFQGLEAQMLLSCDSPSDNSRIYCSRDNVVWVETRGDENDLRYIGVNCETVSMQDAESAFCAMATIMGNIFPSLENPLSWVADKVDLSIDSGQPVSSTISGVLVTIEVTELSGSKAATDLRIYLQ